MCTDMPPPAIATEQKPCVACKQHENLVTTDDLVFALADLRPPSSSEITTPTRPPCPLTPLIRYSPPSDPHTAAYSRLFKHHASRLSQLQGPSGCWPVSLTDPSFFPAPETTGTALFAYGMAFGVRTGILDAQTYLPVVERGWECLSKVALQPSGRVGWCQSPGAGPHRNIKRELTSDYCVGLFGLAASEVAFLAGTQ